MEEETRKELKNVASFGRMCKVAYPMRVTKKPRDIYATRIVDNTGKIVYLVNTK